MPIRIVLLVLFVCNSFTWDCTYADDATKSLLSFLGKASKSVESVAGSMDTYELGSTAISEIDVQSVVGAPASSSRFFKGSDGLIIETLGEEGLADVGYGSKYNGIADVIGFSEKELFSFVPVQSTAEPFANLSIYPRHQAPKFDNRIQTNFLNVINGLFEISGFPIASAAIRPEAKIVGGLSNGIELNIADKTSGIGTQLSFTVQSRAGNVYTTSRLLTQPTVDQELVVETRCAGRVVNDEFRPDYVIRRMSGALFGEAQTELFKLTLSEKEPEINFPIDKYFFKRYERDYTVCYGDSTVTSEMIEAASEANRQLGEKRFALSAAGAQRSGRSIALIFTAILLVALSIVITYRRSLR